MIPLMHAATACIFMTLFAPPDAVVLPPIFVPVPPGPWVDLLIVAAIAHDWRSRGWPHPAYRVGGALLLANQLLANQLLAVPLTATPAWMTIARAVQSVVD